MAPYLILFAYFAIGAIAVGARPVGSYRSSLIIPAIVLVIMIGLRREVGGAKPVEAVVFDTGGAQ